MATTGTLLEAMFSYYGNLSRQALGAMYQTREELRTGSFSFNKALGRAATVWMDAAEGWWSALLVTANAPLPTLFMEIGAEASTYARSINVLVPDGADPEASEIGELGGTHKFPAGAVEVEATRMRDAVEVKLKNKTKLAGYISRIEDESFTLTDVQTGQATTIPYPDIAQVKGNNLTTRTKVIIAASIIAGVIIVLYIVRGRSVTGVEA